MQQGSCCQGWCSEGSKSGRAIVVALNDTYRAILRRQVGNHHIWLFVHKAPVKNTATYYAVPFVTDH
ncbi:hypothetical protein BSQ99_00040 [Serratia liquefaciens]|nr:hypothetical protein BSQ99_00040 [Serratia liquefaciens]